MDIYIKPAEKVQLVGKREVLLRDVAEVFLSGQTAGEAERLVVFRIPEERKKTYLLSVVDLIQLPLIFENMYYLFFEESKEVPKLLSIPYSIGLGLGIIVFFNHFSKITLTQDPTPIEIEMTTYEKETNASVIDHLNRRKGGA